MQHGNGFQWDAGRERRLVNAVNAYNRRLDRLASSGLYDELPNYTTVAAERSLISDADGYNMRVGFLESAQLTKNPGGNNVVELNGVKIPKFWRDDIVRLYDDMNGERDGLRDELHPYFDYYSNVEKATAMANSNIAPFDVADFKSVEDYEQMLELYMEYEKLDRYVDNYIATWNDNLGDMYGGGEVERILRRFMDEDPETLKRIMEEHDIRATIEYVYKVSADQTNAEERYSNVEKFWEEMEAKYLG